MATIQELMTRDVRTCHPDTPLSEACKIMWQGGLGILPVTEAGSERVVGIITDRDVAMAAAAVGRAPQDIPVSAAMNEKVYACGERDGLQAAHALMRTHGVRRVLVTAGRGDLSGVLSLDDLAFYAKAAEDPAGLLEVGQTLALLQVARTSGRSGAPA